MLKKLQQFLSSKNIAELLDDDQLKQIADDVIEGYKIDEASRKDWLDINKEAIKITKNVENDPEDEERLKLFSGQTKLVFPLITPAIIQLSARLMGHVVRNGQAVESKVLGKDYPVVDPQTQQPIPGLYVKAEKAKRVCALMNYELLIKDKTWIQDTNKVMINVSSWGMGFKKVYYDPIDEKICSESIHPEHVVINKNISCLEKAPRITIKYWLSKNEIIEQVRGGYFCDHDLENLHVDTEDEDSLIKNDYEEKQPSYLFLCQTCYIDLDNDGYMEPYKVYVHKESKQVFCIYPSYEYQDLNIDKDGKVIRIKRRLDIVDFHGIDDPEGGYYSIGLHYLLLNPNKALTAIQRQLIDAGTLANAAAVSGFVTKAFKTRERAIKIEPGKFKVLDCNPNVDPSKQILPMPFKEPSQVLLELFQLLISVNNKSGYISDILTGDVEMQNVPATTTLAMVEQASRPFQPLLSKEYASLQQEYQMIFHFHSKYQNQTVYARFQDDMLAVQKQDFDEQSIDIAPVADPTICSEAFKFARQRAVLEAMPIFGPVTNMQEAAVRYWTDLGFDDPQKMVQQPQQPPPDPRLVQAQMQNQVQQQKLQMDAQQQQFEQQMEQQRLQLQQLQTAIKSGQSMVKAKETGAKIKKLQSDAVINYGNLDLEHQKLPIEKQKADAAIIAAHNKGKPTNEQ